MAELPSQTSDDVPEQQQHISRSTTSSSTKERIRPKSRGSTTSLQSVGVGTAFQPATTPPLSQQPQHDPTMPLDPNGFYMQHGAPPQPIYGQNPEDMLLQYQHNMAHMQHHPSIERPPHMPQQQQHELRPMSQHAFQDVQQYHMQFPNGMPQYPVHPQHMHHHMRHHSEQFEGSPAPEDSNNENGGAKRRKGTASSLANDQELRRLLAQYQGKNLKEVASEVQKNEGSGGKSEKAKQVFAMLWLQESCQRSNSSVRRDRVFTRYTEKCANERVPTLNPASFGKLVRIIFPNVQTRRLGVRGESKYHYVDLSLFPEDDERQYTSTFDRPSTSAGTRERQDSIADTTKAIPPHVTNAIERPPSRNPMDTADFPAPRTSFLPTVEDGTRKFAHHLQKPQPPKLDCQYINTPTIRISTRGMATNLAAALPTVRSSIPATLSTYLAMPTVNCLTQPAPSPQESPIELPDIYPYLSETNYDASIAKALFHLYRSYCIDVIDAFRTCKDKSFFNHHSAFNGKMTVPVSKLFSLECLAPWIQECDMRMYKQIVKFLAPLALQNVPDPIWAVFDRIASKLVAHLITAFEEKCPVHVVVAKVTPAARFVNLLKKLKSANTATLQMSRMLEDPHQRTQMWLDLMAMVEPDRLLDESVPPPESMMVVQGMLKHDLRTLVSPLEDILVTKAENDRESTFANLLAEPSGDSFGVLSLELIDQPVGLLERWISWLEHVSEAFRGHHAQCMINWHTKLWRSLMMQIGQGGAHSYQAWWFVEAFTTQMLGWMTQMEGFLMNEEQQKQADDKEQEKKKQDVSYTTNNTSDLKRKRSEEDADETQPSTKRPETGTILSEATRKSQPSYDSINDTATIGVDDEETDNELDELRRGGPLDLPSIHTGFSSPLKRLAAANNHDDSGIDLGLDIDAEAEKEAKKFNKRDWLLSSDPVEIPAGVGVTT